MQAIVDRTKEASVRILILCSMILAATLIIAVASDENNANAAKKDDPTNYAVTNYHSLGGTASAGSSINNRGYIAGFSNLDGDQIVHAALWQGEDPTDLGTIGDPETSNSSVVFPVKNKRGVVVGISQTDTIDPRGERWSCSNFIPFTGHTCVGFRWEDGEMSELPTLGGPNGFAAGINKQGQIVGWAENTVEDPTCDLTRTQRLEFHATIWGPEEDQIQQLPEFPGDTATAAVAINDEGQVVGISGICDRAVGRRSAIHAVIWENGTVNDLGNIGGDAWNTPVAINKYGEIVGFANVAPGPGFNAHAFRWTETEKIQDLGVLPVHAQSEGSISQGLGINKHGQVVGISCLAGFEDCRAFLWEDGEMTDLNDVVPGYSGFLVFANDINDSGEITGGAVDADTGDAVTFIAKPIPGHPEKDDAESSNATSAGAHLKKNLVLTEKTKQMLLQRLGLAGIPWME
jgi:probable HAF family extracellular repeat protein